MGKLVVWLGLIVCFCYACQIIGKMLYFIVEGYSSWKKCTLTTKVHSEYFGKGKYADFIKYAGENLVQDGIFFVNSKKTSSYLYGQDTGYTIDSLTCETVEKYGIFNGNKKPFEYIDFYLEKIIFNNKGMLLSYMDYIKASSYVKKRVFSNSDISIKKLIDRKESAKW